MNSFLDFFFGPYMEKSGLTIFLEIIVFVFGILSVWYAKNEKIAVYPAGLIATTITVYLFYVDKLIGDMLINFYYSTMSIYGWYNWSRKKHNKFIVPISYSSSKEKWIGVLLFGLTFGITYLMYGVFNKEVLIDNWIDIFTSGIFFTAMWFMANKKIEHWILWIIGNAITIPLYCYRGWGILALQYILFTILAFQGYSLWKKSINKKPLVA